jgi:hypothetical protein
VLSHSQLIFPSKTWFFEIYLNFQRQKSLKNQYLSHSESKSYQINSNKSCSSRSFQQHQRHIPIPPKILATLIYFFVKKSFNIQELLHCKSKHHETKLMNPSSSRAFLKEIKKAIVSIINITKPIDSRSIELIDYRSIKPID